MSASAWPQKDDGGHLYHYLSEAAAQDIISEEPPYAEAGTVAHHGFGLYATDIAPSDADALDDVSSLAFWGGQDDSGD